MRFVLLDTDVFSFALKQDTRAALYQQHLHGAQPCLSFQTVAELRLWALLRHWSPARREGLEGSISRCLVLPCDDGTTTQWARVCAHRRRLGRPIGCGDAWVAATALRHQLQLLTHNVTHYADSPDLLVVSQPG